MKISVLYNLPVEEAGPDDLDTLDQVSAVCRGLTELGHDAVILTTSADIEQFRGELNAHRGRLIFNLTDPRAGEGRLISLYPQLLEEEGFAFTGCSSEALYCTSKKSLAKKMMAAGGIPTAYWQVSEEDARWEVSEEGVFPGQFIIKSIWEHGSSGLNADSLVTAASSYDLEEILRNAGPGVFAESFLRGREINIALLGDGDGQWIVLPPSEIIYNNDSQPLHFLDYKSKWDVNSAAYLESQRSFDFELGDEGLIDRLSEAALNCAGLFGLSGYARVDFRLDDEAQPKVLEVNANPCLSPGGGFAAAAEKGGIDFAEMIDLIVNASGDKIRNDQ